MYIGICIGVLGCRSVYIGVYMRCTRYMMYVYTHRSMYIGGVAGTASVCIGGTACVCVCVCLSLSLSTYLV